MVWTVTRKWDIVSFQSNANYDVSILVKADITVTVAPSTQVSIKNCALFTNWTVHYLLIASQKGMQQQ